MSTDVLLQTRGTQFVTRDGTPVKLHGIGLGGWLNMENFIVGFPATESLNRRALSEVLGEELGDYFFERFLDVFFTEADAAAIAACGFNVVRIPVHYRHLEDDARPFELKESGFRRLDFAIEALARHGVYTIIDLHVVPGSQNNEWHCDNPTHHAGFWGHPHFEERVLNLWRALAERYRDNPWVAGYEPLNEPGDPTGEHVGRFFPQLLRAIREVDADHVLFLKGNAFGPEFAFYTEPLPNTVFIAFDYAVPGVAAARSYPSTMNGVHWDRSALEMRFLELTQPARESETPIWIGEFGPVYSGDPGIDEHRYQVLADQFEIYRDYDANWSMWTWKDVNVQGIVYVDSASPYGRRVHPVMAKKARLATDAWGHVDDDIRDVLSPLEERFAREFPGHPDRTWWINRLVRHILLAEPMVQEYAECFRGLTKEGIDEVVDSFALANCVTRERLVEAVTAAVAADSPSTSAVG
jgi:endoglucanase